MVNDEEVISLSHAKVYVFSDAVLYLRRVNQSPASNTVWEEKLSWFKDSPHYRTLDTIDGQPMEFEWNIFAGFTTLQLCGKVTDSKEHHDTELWTPLMESRWNSSGIYSQDSLH